MGERGIIDKLGGPKVVGAVLLTLLGGSAYMDSERAKTQQQFEVFYTDEQAELQRQIDSLKTVIVKLHGNRGTNRRVVAGGQRTPGVDAPPGPQGEFPLTALARGIFGLFRSKKADT